MRIVYTVRNNIDNPTWEDHLWECELLELQKRPKLMANNPEVAARVFNMLVYAFMCVLIGLPLDDTIRTTHERVNMKIFGLALAFCGVIEVQWRGDLHIHVLV